MIQYGKFFTTQYDITIDDIYETLLDISANNGSDNGNSGKGKSTGDLQIDENEELEDKKSDSKQGGFKERVRRSALRSRKSKNW